jgi:hypothetical protein
LQCSEISYVGVNKNNNLGNVLVGHFAKGKAMTFITDAVPSTSRMPATAETVRRPGFFTRVLNAMVEARQRHAEREIAQYLTMTGGRFTDDVERAIERRFFRG